MCVQMCCANNWNIPSSIGWGEWRLTSEDHKHWLIQPSFFWGEGVTWRRDPSQVPQNWKFRGFRPLFFGRSQNSLSTKWRNVRFATGKGGPQNHRKYDRSWYFWCRRKMCVFYVFQLVLNRLWMRKQEDCRKILEFRKQFWNFELKKTLKNSLSGNASNLWQRSYL